MSYSLYIFPHRQLFTFLLCNTFFNNILPLGHEKEKKKSLEKKILCPVIILYKNILE